MYKWLRCVYIEAYEIEMSTIKGLIKSLHFRYVLWRKAGLKFLVNQNLHYKHYNKNVFGIRSCIKYPK